MMDKALYEVMIDGEKLINEGFTMGLFDGITKDLPPLQEYLYFMSNNKQGSLVGSRKEEDMVFPWDLLRSELFYPTHKDIFDNNSFSIFRVEFRDKRKDTAK